MEKKVEKPLIFGKDIGVQIQGNMFGELNHFIVFPYSRQNYLKNQQAAATKPLILTYRGNNTLMGQLMADLRSKQHKLEKKNIYFTLSNGYGLNKRSSVGWLKKFICRNQIDGLVLFVQQRKNVIYHQSQGSEDFDESFYMDQCCYGDYFGVKQEEMKYRMFVNFKIVNTEYLFTFGVQNTTTLQQLLAQFYWKVGEVSKGNLLETMIKRMFIIKNQGTHISVNFRSQSMQKLRKMAELNHFTDNVTINVELFENFEVKVKITDQNKKILIYKQNGSSVEYSFQEIDFMTFKGLYETKLCEDKMAKDNKRCLKVMDTIIKENESLSKLNVFFPTKKDQSMRLVARVITEKMYFYKQVGPLIDSDPNFSPLSYIVPPSDLSENQGDFRQRIQSDVQARVSNASPQSDVWEVQNFFQIFLYAAETIHCYEENKQGVRSNQPKPVYQVLNKTLRQTDYFQTDFTYISKNWIFKYASSLIKLLSQLKGPNQPITVYRGINYDMNVKQGDLVTLKTFVSTSRNREKTYDFLFKPKEKKVNIQTNVKEEKFVIQRTLIQMIIRTGKSISEFAQYPQQEVLLTPFTQFVVKSKGQTTARNQKVTKIVLQELDEKLSPSKYPETKGYFILWVDDKLSQGIETYREIKLFQQSTLLIQFKSTTELKIWLTDEKNQKILKDPTANFVFITNMVRNQNPLAGVEGIIQLQRYTEQRQIPIFIYVGDQKRARQNIQANKNKIRRVKQIKIGSRFQQIEHFLKQTVKISFSTELTTSNQFVVHIDQNFISSDETVSDCLGCQLI